MVRNIPPIFQYYPLEVSTEPAEWRRGWLCRLLRWIYFKLVEINLHDRIFPYWLILLIHARQIYVNYTVETLPNEIIEQIATMRQYLINKNMVPKMIIIGIKKYHELETVTGHSDYWVEDSIGKADGEFMGMEVRISPFVEDGTVLVC